MDQQLLSFPGVLFFSGENVQERQLLEDLKDGQHRVQLRAPHVDIQATRFIGAARLGRQLDAEYRGHMALVEHTG